MPTFPMYFTFHDFQFWYISHNTCISINEETPAVVNTTSKAIKPQDTFVFFIFSTYLYEMTDSTTVIATKANNGVASVRLFVN